jgi:hypothetical protein
MTIKPLRIGISPRFLHSVPPEMGFKGKKLQYLETSIAHWLMTLHALVFMIPSIEGGASPTTWTRSTGCCCRAARMSAR